MYKFLNFIVGFVGSLLLLGGNASFAALTNVVGGGNITVSEAHISVGTAQTLSDLVLTGDFGADQTVTITFVTPGSENGVLNFNTTFSPSFVSDGNVIVDNISYLDTSLTFTASSTGTGVLTIQNLMAFLANDPLGEFYEKRQLNINFQAADLTSDFFVVDSTNYANRGSFSGATGGSSDVFIVGDALSYVSGIDPARGSLNLDLSSIEGSATFDVTGSFVVVESDDDGIFDFGGTLSYLDADVLGITKTFTTNLLTIDNQLPDFDSANHSWFTSSAVKPVLGIGDDLIITPPIDLNGDALTFSADFSDISGTGNLVDVLDVQTLILEEVVVDDSAYVKSMTLKDDAGNLLIIDSETLSLDLQRPVVTDLNLFSITSLENPAVVGSEMQFLLPTEDTGDVISYDVDLSVLAGPAYNLLGSQATQNFSVIAGAIEDLTYSVSFTVYDEAQNSQVFVSNMLSIDNKPPNFDTTCGGTFVVLDTLGESNGIADASNLGADTVRFQAPDNTIAGCEDIASFSIDLSGISGDGIHNYIDVLADGSVYDVLVSDGLLDNRTQTFVLSTKDALENSQTYTSGSVNIDNYVLDPVNTSDSILAGKDIDLSYQVLLGDVLTIKLSIAESVEIDSVSGKIEEAVKETPFEFDGSRWIKSLTLEEGIYDGVVLPFTFIVTDTSGNVLEFEGQKTMRIINDNREVPNGGGGTSGLGGSTNRTQFKRGLVRDQNEKSLNDYLDFREESSSLQSVLDKLKPSAPKAKRIERAPIKKFSYYDTFQQKLRDSRIEIEAKIEDPWASQDKMLKLIYPNAKPEKLDSMVDRLGGFRLQNSQKKIEKIQKVKKRSSLYSTLRKSELAQRGKKGFIRYD